jgi:hypothetical protein
MLINQGKYPRMSGIIDLGVVMSPNRPAYLVVLFILLFSRAGWATTLVVITSKDSIVFASDSKEVSGGPRIRGPKSVNKIVVFNYATAIAITGIAEFDITAPDGKIVFHFDADRILNETKHSLSSTASISSLDSVIVNKLKIAMDGFRPYLANGRINPKNAPSVNYLDFVIVGYDAGIPVIHRVTVNFDWNLGKISGPVVSAEDASPDRPHNFCFGECTAVAHLGIDGSAEQRAAFARYPDAIRGFRHNPISAFNAAADLVRLECEFNPEFVGAPVHLVTLTRNNEPDIKTLLK